MGQLVVVSNRVAIPEKIAEVRPGGLEVAIKAALKDKTGIWFGWSGKIAARAKIATRKIEYDQITYITLDLSKEDHDEYYNGFTNRVLWPILHYRRSGCAYPVVFCWRSSSSPEHARLAAAFIAGS